MQSTSGNHVESQSPAVLLNRAASTGCNGVALARAGGSRACPLYTQVIAPYDAEDSRGLLKASIRDPDPVVFLENEILYGETFQVHFGLTPAVGDEGAVHLCT